jgi:1-acyl-sn-glycerol-3-phosphate acyltransferase
MGIEATSCLKMTPWDYGHPPSALDMVENNLASNGLRLAIHAILRAYLWLFFDYRPHHRAQLQNLSGHLIVANHSSHLDWLAISCAFPLGRVNKIRSICAEDYFFSRPLKGMLAFLLANTIPMERDQFDARALAYCRRQLEEGSNVILFPEGTRSSDGNIADFKAGVGFLALRYGLPVLPVFLAGTHKSCPKGTVVPRPGRIDVVIGRTVHCQASGRYRDAWLCVAQDLRKRIQRLAIHLRRETIHDRITDRNAQVSPALRGPAERWRPHRHRQWPHLRQNARLHLQKPAIG